MDRWQPVLTIGNLVNYVDQPGLNFVAVMERDDAPMYYLGYENNNTMFFDHFFYVNEMLKYHGLKKLLPSLVRDPETMVQYKAQSRFGDPMPVATVYLTDDLYQAIRTRLNRVFATANTSEHWPFKRHLRDDRPSITEWMLYWMKEAVKEQSYPPVIRLQMDFVPEKSNMMIYQENQAKLKARANRV